MGKKKDLKEILSMAAERGLTPKQIVDQSIKIDQLEKKYSKSFQELTKEFETIQKKIEAKSKTLKDLEDKIALEENKKSDLMRENTIDEKSVKEYIDARERLSPMGFAVDDISRVGSFLIAIKSQQYSPDKVVEKLNAIGDLEARKKSLEAELDATNADLRESKNYLAEVRKMRETGLSIDQMSRIRDVLLKISSNGDVGLDRAISQLEESALTGNNPPDQSILADVSKLEEARKTILSEIVAGLKKHDDLKMLEDEAAKKVKALHEEEREIATAVSALSEQKRFLESSISSIEQVIARQLDQSRSSLASLIAQMVSERLERNYSSYEGSSGIVTNQLSDIRTLLQKIDERFSKFLQDTSVERKTENASVRSRWSLTEQPDYDDSGDVGNSKS
jgi:predicted  nucleic acid-binding Zn-ribbon protein